MNGDGVIDFADFLLFASHFGRRSPDIVYNIELVFSGGFTPHQQNVIKKAARKWESIIIADLRDIDLRDDPLELYGDITIDFVDDIKIFVYAEELPDYLAGQGGPITIVVGADESYYRALPFLGQITLNKSLLADDIALFDTALHEMGHVFGIGAGKPWRERVIIDSGPARDAYFTGPLAVEAFNALGGTNYTGGKVPLYLGDLGYIGDLSHWRDEVFGNELMTAGTRRSNNRDPLSLITIQALADLGYTVDMKEADPYNKDIDVYRPAKKTRHAGGLIMKGGALVMKTPNNFALIEFHLVKEMAKYFRKWFRKRTKHKQKKGSNIIFQVPKGKQER